MEAADYEAERARIIATQMEALKSQEGLAMQSLDNLDIEAITPLTPEIISR